MHGRPAPSLEDDASAAVSRRIIRARSPNRAQEYYDRHKTKSGTVPQITLRETARSTSGERPGHNVLLDRRGEGPESAREDYRDDRSRGRAITRIRSEANGRTCCPLRRESFRRICRSDAGMQTGGVRGRGFARARITDHQIESLRHHQKNHQARKREATAPTTSQTASDRVSTRSHRQVRAEAIHR